MPDPKEEHRLLIQHIKDNYASVYLTVVSVIVALALGDLFIQVREIFAGDEDKLASALIWAKIITAFSAALCVWVGYCHIFITVSWILGIWDALSVMLLLVALFLINTTIGLDSSAWWFWATGFFSISGSGILIENMKNARAKSGLMMGALPGPLSWPVIYPSVHGSLSVLFGFLVLFKLIDASFELVAALVIASMQFYWPFLWVRSWKKGLGLS